MINPFSRRKIKPVTKVRWSKIRLNLEQSPAVSNTEKIASWEKYGRPIPSPSAYKQELIKAYARAYHLSTLVETGTYFGEMVEATLNDFEEIYSVELSKDLYKKAANKFRLHKKVHLFQGDSSQVLPQILKKIKQPTLFWLDAHYSAGVTVKGDTNTPVLAELEVLLNHPIKKHLILIDDAREFTGKGDYPTLSQVEKLVADFWPNAHFVSRNDIIRIQPNRKRIDV
jgi:hypothetical protein